jgi:hypothetical protein
MIHSALMFPRMPSSRGAAHLLELEPRTRLDYIMSTLLTQELSIVLVLVLCARPCHLTSGGQSPTSSATPPSRPLAQVARYQRITPPTAPSRAGST